MTAMSSSADFFILFSVFLEEGGVPAGPVSGDLVTHLRIEVILLVAFGGLEVVEGRQIGVRGAGAVLKAAAGHGRRADTGGQVLYVEVREELVHLLVAHLSLILLGGIARPGHDLEVIGEVAEESHAGRNRTEGIVGKGSRSVGERSALAGTFRIDVVHIAGRTGCHEAHRLHAIHEGPAVVVAVAVAEMEGEPVSRHLALLKKQKDGKDAYCFFIAPTINAACIAHFFMLYRTKIAFYGGYSAIVPITLKDFVTMVRLSCQAPERPSPQFIRNFCEYARHTAWNAENEVEWYQKLAAKTRHWLE